jgi:hypothetical protein
MSVWYHLVKNGNEVEVAEPLMHEGGTYMVGGSELAELNVTYNYSGLIAEALGQAWDETKGVAGNVLFGDRDDWSMVNWLDGRNAEETIPELEHVVKQLGDAPGDDYWETTPGNAGHAVALLLAMAREHPEATWKASG